MLAQLILAKQAVLLVFPTQLYLFYCGKAYYRNDLDFNTIPLRGIRGRMWALINSDSKKEGVVLDVGFRIWPIQASSPRPERWKSWITQFNGNLWGMPLWEMDELNKGYVSLYNHVIYSESSLTLLVICPSLCLHSSFHDFQESLNLSLNPAGPVNNNSLIKYALDVLQRKVVRDGDTTGRPQVTGQVLGVDVEAVLKTLVEHATEEFGFAPCDVYRAVFEPVGVKGEHNAAMAALDHSMLTKFVTDFHRGERPDILSHKVITVKPIMLDLLSPDRWVIDFKSPQIARNAVEHLRREEMGVLRELFYLFKRILYGGSLAGRVFEAMAHRKFLDGWQQSDGPAPPYIRMRSNKADPPVFSTDPFNGPDESPMPAPLSANVKKAIQVDLGRSVPPQDVTLAEDQYYIPAADNNPLFDSFTVHHDGGSTFVITIIQITISEKHGGAAEGYLQIRRIMKRVKELVEEEHSGALVRVAYCLVCPEGNVKNVWAMPAGWEECTRVDDHRGPVFYLRIPGSGTLCRSVPIFNPAESLLCVVLVHVENQIDEGKS